MPHLHFYRVRPSGFPAAMLGVLLGLIASADTQAADIKAFTTRTVSISAPATIPVVYLDDAGAIEARLSADLPASQDSAEAVARDRLQDGGQALQHELASAWQGVADAWSLGITTLPAVVVDRRYVVYGEPDLDKAVARIEAYRREQE
ncbi:MAG: TIGR03757 family integrating conjugative element protein [Shinella sp.]|nr:TIGR03757 family integrating conjugative element protein [Shinella sp.]